MKTAMLTLAFLIALAFAFVAPGGASAQASCQTNPSPVDGADPSIIVSAPLAGESATSPLRVTGQARVFEATVSLTLYDADGVEITSTTTNAAEGQVLSDFSTDMPFSVTTSTPACLWVFESSARDGSPVNVVQVPLTLSPVGGLPPTGTGAAADAAPMLGWLIAGLALVGVILIGAGKLAMRTA